MKYGLATILGAVLLALTGCQAAIRGNWVMERATPNKYAFAIERASFRNDDTYTATITIDGATAQETGGYAFSGSQLKLRPTEGGQHTFQAELQYGELHVKRGTNLVVLRPGKRGV